MAGEGVQPKERRSLWKAASVHFVSFVTNKPHGPKMKKDQKKCSLYNCFPGIPTYLGAVCVNCNHHLQTFSVQRNVGLHQQVQIARVLEGRSEHCITLAQPM